MSEWQSERRAHAREGLVCPVRVDSDVDNGHTGGYTLNISDSGAMFTVPITFLSNMPSNVKVSIAVPRTTANTHMLERVATEATIVRHEPMVDEEHVGIAVRFSTPLDLQLTV